MIVLPPDQRRALRARAHALDPVVSIADNGLAEAVLKEIEVCLNAHELIKIRVYSDDRELREAYLRDICARLDAAPVQHIGKLLVIWRPLGEAAKQAARQRKSTGSRRRARVTKRSQQGSARKS